MNRISPLKTVLGPAVLAATILQVGTASAGFTFSVDPASPATGTFTPNDILTSGPSVVVPEAVLGLTPGDNLNALSQGNDIVVNPALGFPPKLNFSVDRVSIGTPGSAVESEALASEAHGDVFVGGGMATNVLIRDESTIPLTPGFFGDDFDALNHRAGLVDFFSVDFFSTANAGGTPGTGVANDIFVGSLGTLFADGDLFGLHVDDDLDALALIDRGTPGVLDPGIDFAYFSLSSFSPTTFTGSGGAYLPALPGTPIVPGTVSPADIFFTDFAGPILMTADAFSNGLHAFDELNALAVAVPEATETTILGLGLAAMLLHRRKKRA